MDDRNVLVTGAPRSGTTLTCHLLAKLPDTVALHEPMRVQRRLANRRNHDARCKEIESFCEAQRRSLRERGSARSKHVGGAVPDNPVGKARTGGGVRMSIASRGRIVIDKPLSPEFMLVVKHNSAFVALLPALVKCFTVHGVIRNPLATIASWSSVDFHVKSGHSPAAEQFDPTLKAELAAIGDALDRQIHLIGWFHGRLRQYLPDERIIRYEAVVESGGKVLRSVRPEAEELDEPMQSQNTSSLYDAERVRRIADRLLRSDGPQWAFYDRHSVESLLAEMTKRVVT